MRKTLLSSSSRALTISLSFPYNNEIITVLIIALVNTEFNQIFFNSTRIFCTTKLVNMLFFNCTKISHAR